MADGTERINGIKMNLMTMPQAELMGVLAVMKSNVLDAQTDRQIVQDYYDRRFGVATVVNNSLAADMGESRSEVL